MARCRKCGGPIFFLSEEPQRSVVGGFTGNVREVVTEPRPVPIDVDPDPRGDIAIYEVPSPTCVWGKHWKGERQKYFRRLYHFALKNYVALGGQVYRSHFDTCPNRNR